MSMWIGYAKIVVISFHNKIIKLPAKLTGTLISKLLCCVCFVKMCLHGLLLISFMQHSITNLAAVYLTALLTGQLFTNLTFACIANYCMFPFL